MGMNFRILLSCLLACGALSLPLNAQNNGGNTGGNTGNGTTTNSSGDGDEVRSDRFWEANVGGGQFLVELSRITSVSMHRYVLDGSLLIDEVTIDTNGQVPARFYFIQPITNEMRGSGLGSAAANLTDRGQQLLNRASEVSGSSIQDMVQKKFPLTTHTKQIEYRVMSKQALNSLYQSAKRAWTSGRGRTFTEK